MKLCRFNDDRLGLVQGDQVRDVTAALAVLPSCRYPLPRQDLLVTHLPAVQREVLALAPSAPCLPLAGLTLLSPVANPGKIMAAPVNYQLHLEEARAQSEIHHQNRIEEIQRVGLFLKAGSALVGPSAGVQIQHPHRRNDHEAELVVVIGRSGRNILASQALAHIAGYCAGLDMTTRGPEERSLRKSIDSYCVLGPWLVTADEVPNPQRLDMWLDVNGQRMQTGNTRTMVFGVAHLVSYVSQFMTLMPGDIIITGTPPGVGMGMKPPVFLKRGDVMTLGIQGLGEQRQKVVAFSLKR